VSDTVWFCKTVLMGRDAEQLMSDIFGKVMAEMVGAGNKLVLMDNRGHVSIVDESDGAWDGCCWFSNDCYRSAYRGCKAGYRGLSFGDLPLWEQAVTQRDVWEGVDAELLEEEEWRALADERAWREAREAMRRDADGA
jgi:hypothetical protein